MSTRGRESNVREKRGKSPSLSRRSETLQQRQSPNPPSPLERKKVSSSTQDPKKQPSSDKNKPPRISLDRPASLPSKLTSTRSRSSERNVIIGSSSKTPISTKRKDVGKSPPPPQMRSLQAKNSNSVNVKKKQSAPAPVKGLIEKKTSLPSDQEDRHVAITHEEAKYYKNIPFEDDDILLLGDASKQDFSDYDDDLLTGEVEFEDGDGIALGEPFDPITSGADQYFSESESLTFDGISVDNEQVDGYKDQADGPSDFSGENILAGGNPELENDEQVVEGTATVKETSGLISEDVEHTESEPPLIPEAKPKDEED